MAGLYNVVLLKAVLQRFRKYRMCKMSVISKSILFQIKVVEDMKDAQRQLYQWRMEFFHENFKSLFFNPDQEAPNWITLGLDDSHPLDTVPFQITQNFDEVLKLASTRRPRDGPATGRWARSMSAPVGRPGASHSLGT